MNPNSTHPALAGISSASASIAPSAHPALGSITTPTGGNGGLPAHDGTRTPVDAAVLSRDSAVGAVVTIIR